MINMRFEYEYTDRNTNERVHLCFFEPHATKMPGGLSIGIELTCIKDYLSDYASGNHPITIESTPIQSTPS